MSVYKLYLDKGTFIHRLNPLVKLTWLFAVVLLAWMFNRWEYALVIFIWALLYPILAKVHFRKLFVGATLFFVVWTTILSILLWPVFLRGGQVVFTFGPLVFTDIGLSVALAYPFRIGACLVAALTFFMTTSQRELIEGVYGVGVPYQFSFGIMLALRYAPVILGEIGRVREAQKARAFNWNRGSIIRRIKAFSENTRVLVVPVFSRMLRSVNEIALCLDSKGCDFSKTPERRKITLTASDKAFLAVTLGVTLVCLILRLMGYGWITMIM